jgi:hypothetical protein
MNTWNFPTADHRPSDFSCTYLHLVPPANTHHSRSPQCRLNVLYDRGSTLLAHDWSIRSDCLIRVMSTGHIFIVRNTSLSTDFRFFHLSMSRRESLRTSDTSALRTEAVILQRSRGLRGKAHVCTYWRRPFTTLPRFKTGCTVHPVNVFE